MKARRLNSHSTYAVILFLIISIFEGGFFLTNVGALTLPDGDMHANASYGMATGQIMNRPEDLTDPFGNPVKRQYISGDSRYLHNKGMHNALVADLISDPFATDPHIAKQRKADQQPSTQVTLPDQRFPARANQYFPLVYLPQGIGMWIGLHTGLSPYNVWQCGRIANFAFYLLLFGLAIVLIPKGKYFMAVLGSLYPTIFMASSLMSDAVFISICACFIAYFFALSTREKPITRGQLGILMLLTICLFLFKTVYVALALLVLALPKTLLTTKRKCIFTGVSAVVALLIYGLWSSNYQNVPAIASIANNTHFMFRHPVRVLYTISWNLLEFPKTLLIIGPTTLVPTLFVLSAWLILFISNRNAPTNRSNPTAAMHRYRYVWVSFIAFFCAAFLAYLFIDLTWNDMTVMKATQQVQGFQGRYLTPLLPLLTSICFSPHGKSTIPRALRTEAETVEGFAAAEEAGAGAAQVSAPPSEEA